MGKITTPHLSTGEGTRVLVPAKNGIAAYHDRIVPTACGREVSSTLVTKRVDRIRCPACKTTAAHPRCTPAAWALLTDREQVVTINRAYEAAVTEEATRRANVCEWCGNAVRQDPVVGLCHVSVAYDHDHKAR